MSFQNGEQLLQDLSATNLNEPVIEKPHNGDLGNKKDKSNNCKELQNIAYKTKRFNGTEIVPLIVNTNNSTLSNFLNNETIANEKENWCKLDKTQKVKKLVNYVEHLENKYTLSGEESNKCNSYLIKFLEFLNH
jgi:hypothetical protein